MTVVNGYEIYQDTTHHGMWAKKRVDTYSEAHITYHHSRDEAVTMAMRGDVRDERQGELDV
jgi:hypothetical protein